MRTAEINRKTNETDIKLKLNLDGSGVFTGTSGIGFFDHMLTLFSKHGRFDLELDCKGDLEVDCHHTVEDIGICLGQAFADALGDCAGITRYGAMILPMDETLILTAVDISGRSLLLFDCDMPSPQVGTFDTELCEEFFIAFSRNAKITLHIHKLVGKNTHHIIEGIFKAVARAMKTAVSIDGSLNGEIPSSKGVL
ncbi:MAG: imidazoleglycerol-phosphate dehydratase HisB [Ruminococcaceae bacterium]|nr:imidazoleglycerol-phosphate dehydratase HisB [Oscillospiraceae bacterium]